MRLYFDTSVLVSALVSGHSHHAAAYAALEQVPSARHDACISSHGFAEVYSVLTRTPFVPPVYPLEAWQLLEESILPHFNLIGLTPGEYSELVHQCAREGWTGGRVYDAIHLRSAQKARCDRIYTFNVRDFRALAPAGLEDKICSP